MTYLHGRLSPIPPTEAARKMFRDWRVMVAGMFFGTVIILGLLAVVGYLALNDRSTEAVMVIVSSLIVPMLTVLLSKVSTVQHHVNGNTSRLLDATLGPARPPADPPHVTAADQIR